MSVTECSDGCTAIGSKPPPTLTGLNAGGEDGLMLAALLRRQHEHPVPTALEVQPGEVHFRVQRLDMHLAIAHFNNQQTLLGQMVRRLGQHAPHQVQAIIAAGQAQLRFVLVFIRHVGEVFGIHIRRVGHNQVKALARQTVETITLHGVHALVDAMALDVLVGHFQGFEGQVPQHHFGVLELIGASDADAPGARAQVEDACRRLGQPGLKAVFDQLADRRTRDQHALINDKRHAAEPGLFQQVSGGHALMDAAMQQTLNVGNLFFFQVAIQIAVGNFPRQVQGAEHQLPGFVPGIVGTMPEKQLFPMETADSPSDVVAQGAQAGSDHGGKLLEKTTGDSNSLHRYRRRTKPLRHPSEFIQIAIIGLNTRTS
ncbi:hypothetical protein ALQ29_05593 [Pseudomonas marginalis pv. marginalis]|uniref:Uncharacterized protein n=1 Tax=Pseudomonas marginalis pv. marginalis TaxID=97473 RepID=A0A3M3WGH6_PSEMA|nr:hypothetical protein ALQ38_05558 [Pseudomonas marginalis pv. marginalis]RMP01461.1 hypothetical protein ALQ29_05593 [Pseudomonas marginalis pv. marginalis]